MSKHGITQCRVGQTCHHGNLHGRSDLTCPNTKTRKPEDAIPIDLNRSQKEVLVGGRVDGWPPVAPAILENLGFIGTCSSARKLPYRSASAGGAPRSTESDRCWSSG